MRIAKKYLLFSGLGRKKVGLTRVRIANKIHSLLLPVVPRVGPGQFTEFLRDIFQKEAFSCFKSAFWGAKAPA